MNDATIGTWSYRAGDWFAVFGANTTLLLPASERERVVASVGAGRRGRRLRPGPRRSAGLGPEHAPGLRPGRRGRRADADPAARRRRTRHPDDRRRDRRARGRRQLDLGGADRRRRDRAGRDAWVRTSAGPDFPIDGGLVRVTRIDLPPAGRAPRARAAPGAEPSSRPTGGRRARRGRADVADHGRAGDEVETAGEPPGGPTRPRPPAALARARRARRGPPPGAGPRPCARPSRCRSPRHRRTPPTFGDLPAPASAARRRRPRRRRCRSRPGRRRQRPRRPDPDRRRRRRVRAASSRASLVSRWRRASPGRWRS